MTRQRLCVAAVALAAASWGSRRAGSSAVPGGPLDETAHLLTTLLIMWGLGPRACERFVAPALVASVAIDVDHIPDRLGAGWLTAGTPRPYTHSLTTIAVVLLAAVGWRRQRDLMVGVAIGLALHFWRDLSESGSGVSLLWPCSYRAFSIPYGSYVIAMAAVVAFDAYRLRGDACA